MATISLPIDSIEIGQRHRALAEDAVTRLAESMKAIGLRCPITVRVVNDYVLDDGEVCDGVPVLVAGRHRLAAAKSLGWSHIDCIDVDDDEISAELWEIAENLHRLDLTKEQRDAHIRRYAELLKVKAAIVPQIAEQSTRPVGRPKSVTTQIAEATGLSDDTIRRALKPEPAQPSQPKPVKSDAEVILAQANAIVAAWNRACPEAREMALEQIDGPVMDGRSFHTP